MKWISTSERQPSVNDRYLVKASYKGGEPLVVSAVWRTDKWGISASNIQVHAWLEGLPTIKTEEPVFKAIQQGMLNHMFMPLGDPTKAGAYYYLRSSFDSIIIEVTETELLPDISHILYIRIV